MSKEKEPKLVMCSTCELHGHFLFSNGEESPEFPSYERGLEILLGNFPRHKDNNPELVFFIKELSKSSVCMYPDLEKKIEEAFGYPQIVIHSIIKMMEAEKTIEIFHEEIVSSLLECHLV